MKEHIADLIQSALTNLISEGTLPADTSASIHIENTRDKAHGDLASNVALTLAKAARCNPRQLAEKICAALPQSDQVVRTEIAGPGFINFFINQSSIYSVVEKILTEGSEFGRAPANSGPRVQVEFVSANPTGPLHVGHGRGAAYGASVADLLEAAGLEVEREYYVNDAGRQMNILAASVWLRYLEDLDMDLVFPTNAYQGHYIRDIAHALQQEHGNRFLRTHAQVFDNLPADEPMGAIRTSTLMP
ncbi:arginine--tRNA ligase [Nitrincola nitratireducens]|uniref:Arginine--tRNA ligase n=1 Tax=Nitrincola nitratireducens TaxID=1229521 RepID=W9UUD8_9GAMM|nr:arginine--tRNA ligase [Nitrincola nitratireducens]EXJ10833.1 Arginine--tRNA ligase [Nitrincola nitratireducens]